MPNIPCGAKKFIPFYYYIGKAELHFKPRFVATAVHFPYIIAKMLKFQNGRSVCIIPEFMEKQFGSLLASPQIRYLNLGGGHWITKPDYDRPALINLLREIREMYHVEVYLEPGEAWAIHTGVLRARVLDVFDSLGYQHAILDVSASAHMPDVLEMPYRPEVYTLHPAGTGTPAVTLPGEAYTPAGEPGEKAHTYRLGAPTCLAGDVIGDYSFDHPLQVDDTIILDDMSHYTIVKTTHFNGVPHPDIAILQHNGSITTAKRFGYADFESRLG